MDFKPVDKSHLDSQNVPRGSCKSCLCSRYKKPFKGNDCENCKHKPTQHEQTTINNVRPICPYPGCGKPVWVENGKELDYCGRTHASQHKLLVQQPANFKQQGNQSSNSHNNQNSNSQPENSNSNHSISNNPKAKVLWVSSAIDKAQYALIRLLKNTFKVIKAFDPNEALNFLHLEGPFDHVIIQDQTANENETLLLCSAAKSCSKTELTWLSGFPISDDKKKFLVEQRVNNVFTYSELEAAILLNQPKKIIHFYNKNEPYYEFTNFWEGNPIQLDGKEWMTAEHYFQAQKFVHAPMDIREQVRTAPTPREAFELARTYGNMRRNDWEAVKDDIMKKVVFEKFSQHPHLKNLLLNTGNAILVEHTKNDSYWGDGGDGSGKNMLGIILVQVREMLRQPASSINSPNENKTVQLPKEDFTGAQQQHMSDKDQPQFHPQ